MPTSHARLARLAVTAATVAVALAAADPAGAAPPPTLPAGYVQIVDDTGTITVAVPDTWTDVDTVPAVNPDGTPQPWIEAAPDRQAFEDTWNVPGVLFYAAPFTADPQSLMDTLAPSSGCTFEVQPYDDGVFVGLIQVGEQCGPGEALWRMVVASPADQAWTAVVQVQGATPADAEAVDIVLRSFNATSAAAGVPGSTTPASSAVPTTVAAAGVPGVSVPAGLGPVEVATLFLDSLAAGDGATACALLAAEEMTTNFVEEAETCAIEMTLQVLGQGEFWSSVVISGDETTSSPGQCGDEDPADDYVSLELAGPSDNGCLSIGIENGEWRIEDLSNSIWNQAS